MRIVSGIYGGRIVDAPKGHRTHPMSEKARGGLFNSLGDIAGLTVLDAFAGSGALGFEALSRGASFVQMCDPDKNAYEAMIANSKTLKLSEDVCLASRVYIKSWLNRHNDTFDLILCDPPYDDLQDKTIEKIALRVNKGGKLILSWPKLADAMAFDGFELENRHDYGDAIIYIFKKL